MKLTLERDALHEALGRISRIVERRATIAICTHLHLRAEAGTLHVRGTDLDMEAATSLPCDVATSGEAAVPAHLLADIAARLPSGAQIRMERDGFKMALKSGRARASLNVLDAADFPDNPPFDATWSFDLPAADLATMLARVEFAISSEETRYYLNGVYLHATTIEGNAVLRTVATDGHRLSLYERATPAGAEGLAGVIIPRKAVAELRRLLKEASAPVKLAIETGRLRATIPGKGAETVLVTKLIDGTFPDYERILPRANSKMAVVDRAATIGATERIACMQSERGRAIRLNFDDGKLILASTASDTGEMVDEVDADYTAAPMEIGFNATYFAEALANMPGETAHIALADPGSPTLLRESASAANLIVIMPMRV